MKEEAYCIEHNEWVDVNDWCKLCWLRTTKALGVPCGYESNIYLRRIIEDESN